MPILKTTCCSILRHNLPGVQSFIWQRKKSIIFLFCVFHIESQEYSVQSVIRKTRIKTESWKNTSKQFPEEFYSLHINEQNQWFLTLFWVTKRLLSTTPLRSGRHINNNFNQRSQSLCTYFVSDLSVNKIDLKTIITTDDTCAAQTSIKHGFFAISSTTKSGTHS